eukprot:2308974-Rhodomonas_salina.1
MGRGVWTIRVNVTDFVAVEEFAVLSCVGSIGDSLQGNTVHSVIDVPIQGCVALLERVERNSRRRDR